MKLKEALEWAEKNTSDEAVNRLKSRKVALVLAAYVNLYRAWIAEHGAQTDTCTFYILNDVCEYCRCNRRKNLG